MLPDAVIAKIEQEASRINRDQLKKGAQALSVRYQTESGHGKRLVTTTEDALAYAIMRMPATYGAVRAALSATLTSTTINPKTLLDVGAGTGAATFAASSLFAFDQIVCLEREAAMRQTGENFMAAAEPTWQEVKWHAFDLTTSPLTDHADLVIASYVLNELQPQKRREAWQALWQAADQMLLIIEPGTPAAYAQLMEARAFLLAKGAHILAPCPHERECPMLEGDWCHFTTRIARSALHRQVKEGEVPYEDEKFSYLAIVKEEGKARNFARVLRHPIHAKGHSKVVVCDEKGIEQLTVTKKHGERYKQVRKAHPGDEIGMFLSKS